MLFGRGFDEPVNLPGVTARSTPNCSSERVGPTDRCLTQLTNKERARGLGVR